MKILSLHCDYIRFKPVKKAIKEPEELTKAGERGEEIKQALVVLTAVESFDSIEIVKDYVENIKDIATQVKAERIVLYPYAHLSSDLSSPGIALEIMKKAEEDLKGDYEVHRAPFGYYKEFELKCKGHPLAELSRSLGVQKVAEGKVEMKAEKPFDLSKAVKGLSKVKMVAERGKNGLKSNVEIGRDLDLYFVNEIIGTGLPLLTPNGSVLRREIERFIVDEEIKRGYQYTYTPIIAKSDLYKISGHWDHYKENMFILNVGKEVFALRPMTCPFQFIIYKSKPRSYKELPIRYAEISNLFRNEKSGELMGLTRLRQFTLADAHIICRPDQLETEFAGVLNLVQYIMKMLKIDVWYRFSKWDPRNKEKYIDNPEAWEKSQSVMRGILDNLGLKYIEAENEAAFYGPKLDLQYHNVFGKEDTLITIQIDFALPERFDMKYTDDNNKQQTPMVIHRSSVGCIERTMAYILEKSQGNLPVWLSPVQARVISFTDRNIPGAQKVLDKLRGAGIRTDSDFENSTVNVKVRNAEMMKIPYLITIGDKEEENGTIALKKRGKDEKPKFGVNFEDFIEEIRKEIMEKG